MIWFLQNQLSKWTNLILADDLYTVFNCDFICVNENGQKKARIQCLVHSIQWFSMQYRWILCLLSLVSQWRLVSMAKYVMLASTRGSRTSTRIFGILRRKYHFPIKFRKKNPTWTNLFQILSTCAATLWKVYKKSFYTRARIMWKKCHARQSWEPKIYV